MKIAGALFVIAAIVLLFWVASWDKKPQPDEVRLRFAVPHCHFITHDEAECWAKRLGYR